MRRPIGASASLARCVRTRAPKMTVAREQLPVVDSRPAKHAMLDGKPVARQSPGSYTSAADERIARLERAFNAAVRVSYTAIGIGVVANIAGERKRRPAAQLAGIQALRHGCCFPRVPGQPSACAIVFARSLP